MLTFTHSNSKWKTIFKKKTCTSFHSPSAKIYDSVPSQGGWHCALETQAYLTNNKARSSENLQREIGFKKGPILSESVREAHQYTGRLAWFLTPNQLAVPLKALSDFYVSLWTGFTFQKSRNWYLRELLLFSMGQRLTWTGVTKKKEFRLHTKKLENQIEKHVWVHTLINYLVGSIHYRIMFTNFTNNSKY